MLWAYENLNLCFKYHKPGVYMYKMTIITCSGTKRHSLVHSYTPDKDFVGNIIPSARFQISLSNFISSRIIFEMFLDR